MKLTEDRIRPLYRKNLAAALGSGLIESAYSLADAIVLGHYYGAAGEATLSVFMPVWNLLFGTGLMFGIGGAALYSMEKGAGREERAQELHTVSVVLFSAVSLLFWLLFLLFRRRLFFLFGADEEIAELLSEYSLPIAFVLPCYGLAQMLGAFLRNDGASGRAARAALSGGLFNIVFDAVFVFGLDLGMYGAGLATALGALITVVIMLPHYLKPDSGLRFVKLRHFGEDALRIVKNGFSSFALDMALGVTAVFFNRQIMSLYDSEILGVYGAVCQAACIIQSSAYAVSEAAQPLLSENHGAGLLNRVRETMIYAGRTAFLFGLFWLLSVLLFPKAYLRIFMSPSERILAEGPLFLRLYGLSFLLLPFNVLLTFFFQSVDQPPRALLLTLARGFFFSGILVFTLPLLFPALSVWAVMPVTELITALWGTVMLTRYKKRP